MTEGVRRASSRKRGIRRLFGVVAVLGGVAVLGIGLASSASGGKNSYRASHAPPPDQAVQR